MALASIPQLLELVAGTDIGANIGFSFESPIVLPAVVNAALPVVGAAAALERATRLVYSRWLDPNAPDLFD